MRQKPQSDGSQMAGIGIFSLPEWFRTHPPRNEQFFTVAIDGRGGSGKTALAKYLLQRYPEMIVVKWDDYFEPNDDSVMLGAHDQARFFEDVIAPLQRGKRIAPRRYDWVRRKWGDSAERVIEKVFCLDGCFAFEQKVNWDVRIWVEAGRAEALAGAVKRESLENGWKEPPAQFLEAWRRWQAREDDYIARVRPLELATVVVDGRRAWEEQIR